MSIIENLRPVWWESVLFGAAAYGFDTGRRRFFNLASLIFYWDLDGMWNSRWVHTSSLIDRTFA